MSESNIKYLLGIDGGGTKTEFLLTDWNEKEIKRIFLGASNPVNIGIENTKSILRQGITEICEGFDFAEISVFAGLAGGEKCMFKAAENAEDNPEAGIEDLKSRNFCNKDILIGISASGSAAYVISAVNYAKSIGAKTASITNNPDTELGKAADIDICADTGPEVITGSTRMKAGTAQKIILNMISTASMVKCGCVYENMMINLRPTNKKLRRRMIGIVTEILGCTAEKAEKLLEENEWSIRKSVDK